MRRQQGEKEVERRDEAKWEVKIKEKRIIEENEGKRYEGKRIKKNVFMYIPFIMN